LTCNAQLVRRAREASGLRTHCAARSSLGQLLAAMIQQALAGCGSLGHHLRLIMKAPITDSAAILRRASLHWEFFQELFARVLKPLARPQEHPESFHAGLRVLALDGSDFSLPNSKAVLAMERPRRSNQHGQGNAAFMKWSTAVLLELGTHTPLSVACSTLGLERMEMEMEIARRTLPVLGSLGLSLLLADRLYGCASFMLDVQEHSGGKTHCLMRVRENLHARTLQVLADGTALVQVRSDLRARTKAGPCVLTVREIRAQVQRAGGKAQPLRLWTTLLDAAKHPALTLLELYATRWEQELFFRELKNHVGANSLLKADSEQTAQGAFAAMILAANEVAHRRVEAAGQAQLPVLRLSIAKITRMLSHLAAMMEAGEGVLTPAQRSAMSRKWLKIMMREAVIPPRRKRSCQHGLRRPHSPWPVVRQRCEPDPTVVLTLLHHTSP
jgi:hypothetical protein